MEDIEKAEAREPFGVATAQAQSEGYTDFSENSPGAKRRGDIAEGIKRSQAQKSSDDLSKAQLGTVLDEVFKSLEDLFKD